MGWDISQIFAFASDKASKAKDGVTSVVGNVGDYSGDFGNKAQGAADVAGNFFRKASG